MGLGMYRLGAWIGFKIYKWAAWIGLGMYKAGGVDWAGVVQVGVWIGGLRCTGGGKQRRGVAWV